MATFESRTCAKHTINVVGQDRTGFNGHRVVPTSRGSLIVQEPCERWPSWAVRPNEPSGFRGRKVILNHASALVTACP